MKIIIAGAGEVGYHIASRLALENKDVLVDAFSKAIATDKVQNWAKENYYLLSGATGEESRKIFAALQSNFAWTLHELGAAKVSPDTLGIPKP